MDSHLIRLKLRAYTDASYGSATNGRSQMCYGFDLTRYYDNKNNDEDFNNDDIINYPHPGDEDISTGVFYTKTAIHTAVDLLSCQAEITAMVECTEQVAFYTGLLEELLHQQTDATPVYNDNEALESMATKPSGKIENIKHMLPKINYIIEETKNAIIKPLHMDTKDLAVDIGTKAIVGIEFKYKTDLSIGPNYDTDSQMDI
jgi:hypothetical protein